MAIADLGILSKIGDTHLTLAERVYRELRSSLADGVFPPGARLTVVDLARSMAVSRSPVVEAVSRLRAEGLLTPLAQGGFAVPALSEQEIADLYDARMMCQLHSVRLALPTITQAQIDDIRKVLAEYQDDNVDSILRLRGSGIAGALVGLGSNQVVSDWFELLDIRLQHYRLIRHQYYCPDPERQATADRHHAMILSAIAERDLNGVEEALRIHTRWNIADALTVKERLVAKVAP